MPLPSSGQLSMAAIHKIPLDQAHTVNLEKYKAYMKWYWSEEQKLERFLDSMIIERKVQLRDWS